MLNPPVILNMYFTTFGGLEYSPRSTREPWYSIAERRCNVKAIPVQLQNPVAPGCNGLARLDGHSWASHFFFFFPILLFCFFVSLHPLILLWNFGLFECETQGETQPKPLSFTQVPHERGILPSVARNLAHVLPKVSWMSVSRDLKHNPKPDDF